MEMKKANNTQKRLENFILRLPRKYPLATLQKILLTANKNFFSQTLAPHPGKDSPLLNLVILKINPLLL